MHVHRVIFCSIIQFVGKRYTRLKTLNKYLMTIVSCNHAICIMIESGVLCKGDWEERALRILA